MQNQATALLIQPAHETFNSHMANSRQHSELVGDDRMPVTRGGKGGLVSGASFPPPPSRAVHPAHLLHTEQLFGRGF